MSTSPGLAPPPLLDVSSPPPATLPTPIVSPPSPNTSSLPPSSDSTPSVPPTLSPLPPSPPPSSDSPPPTPSTLPPLPLSPPTQPPIPPLPLSPPTQPPIPTLPLIPPTQSPLPALASPPPTPATSPPPPLSPPTQPPIPTLPLSPPTQSPLPALASPPPSQSPPAPSQAPPPPSPSLPPPSPSPSAPSASPPSNPSLTPPSAPPPPSPLAEPPNVSTSSSPPPAPLLGPPSPVASSPPPPQSPPLPPPALSSPSPPFVSPPASYSPLPLSSKAIKSPPSLPLSLIIPPPPPSSSRTGLIVGVAIGGVAVLAVFVLLWLLFTRKKSKKDSHGSEGYYIPRDSYNGGPAKPGHQSYPPSGEQFPVPNPSTPPIVVTQSTSYSTGPPQPLSANVSGVLWSNGSAYDNSVPSSTPGLVLGSATSSFSYEELEIATNGFSTVNLLGQGGFGYVHKGVLPNGKIVAVKSLKADSGQGDREFQAEVETISRVHHKHLVSLVGYCITGLKKLLVYEFVENNTFEFHMHGKGQPVMNWESRLKIAIGAAKGLAYLHEDCHPKVIHRDIKAANILLDFNYEAMVADFGLAKFSSDSDSHISTRVMGTFGYLAPEYAASGKLTEKSDIFSFGVVLLELITGRRPVDYTLHSEMEDSLVDWARPLFSTALQDGNFDSLVDPRLEKNYNFEEMGCMITCAASSVRHSAKLRPRMSQIVRALEGNLSLSELNDGVKPGFSSIQGSIDIDNDHHKEDMLRFREMSYETRDSASSQFGATTSEYGP